MRIWIILLFSLFFSSCFAKSTTPRWIVMRHGEAQHNIQGRYNSNPLHANYWISNLTEKGQTQARASAKTLLEQGFDDKNIHHVLVSPLPRTRETAAILVKEGVITPGQIHIEPLLIEMQAGDREGRRHIEGEDSWDHSLAYRYHGETDEDLSARMVKFIEKANQHYPNGTILIVTHGSPALELIKHWTGKGMRLPTAGVKILYG